MIDKFSRHFDYETQNAIIAQRLRRVDELIEFLDRLYNVGKLNHEKQPERSPFARREPYYTRAPEVTSPNRFLPRPTYPRREEYHRDFRRDNTRNYQSNRPANVHEIDIHETEEEFPHDDVSADSNQQGRERNGKFRQVRATKKRDKIRRFRTHTRRNSGRRAEDGSHYELSGAQNTDASQRFLGMANFNARFTARLAEAAGLLIKLTKKGEPWKWGDAEIKAFHAVKQLFCKSLFLNHPVKGKGYVLYTDASSKALGAVLCQEIEPGDVRIIYMASRTLKGAELNYYTTELELLAIVWALEKFRSYVYGQPVEVRTDHQALTFLRTSWFLSQRLLRWSLLIQDYNLKVKHIPGKENILADHLSRPQEVINEQRAGEAKIYALLARHPKKSIVDDLKRIRELQADDPHIKRLQASNQDNIAIDTTGIIIWKTTHGTKCYLPRTLLRPLVTELHDLYGHVGSRKCTT
ncbi:unnamed protein product [Trichogramma brassicae]|uniref:Reverse transcriptase RNase H-like domain-containing protein n=1 Tax=Trichogramma brassicae TaxID=86971 RepID=A0A6H5HXP1_9HYME|nr:unnamed protein product [Trichogramma brassicae]